MRKSLWLLVLPLIAACGGTSKEQSQPAQDTVTTTIEESVPVAMATRNVACGCSLENVGTCGNYIEIDGNYVRIANSKELGLGAMEWCGDEGVTAESSGELRGSLFFATTLVANSGE